MCVMLALDITKIFPWSWTLSTPRSQKDQFTVFWDPVVAEKHHYWRWLTKITTLKWTLIRASSQAILSLLSLDNGKIEISPDLEVPGPGVGLMPQSLALHPYFSCREILWYYATMAGVLPVLITKRITTILRFLKLSAKVRWQTFEIFLICFWFFQGIWSS